MKLTVYGYVASQYKRHGVKSDSAKIAGTAAVRNQLIKFTGEQLTPKQKAEEKARTRSKYGSNVKGTNTHYYVEGETFVLDPNSPEYSEQKAAWDKIVTRLTNVATRLEAHAQADLSKKKEAYVTAKNEAFAEILGDKMSTTLDAQQKRTLDARLQAYTFEYYESYVMITVICDEMIDSLAHCLQDKSTEDGSYVYHIRSKKIVTNKLLTDADLENLDKAADDFVKLIPSKDATRFKTTLVKVTDNMGNLVGYKRFLSELDS
jgi:hypothetical protein